MTRNHMWLVVAMAFLASPVFAQSVEISVNGGYTFSEGVEVDQQTVIGLLVSEVNPKSAGSYGVNASFFIGEQAQVGFNFGQQFSTLDDIGDRRAVIGER